MATKKCKQKKLVNENILKCELCDKELPNGYTLVQIPKYGLCFQCCDECVREVFKLNL
ncbi:MAG: hypothetical protein HDT28_01985 [Clostridiales bacterium]|nr:hypothetical protein [Clostridiales bacterium]